MAADADADRIAAHLLSGASALRNGDAERAVHHLATVVDDPSLAASHELDDIRARACTLLAQAMLQRMPVDEARVEALLDQAAALDPGAAEAVDELKKQLFDRRQERLEAEARASRSQRLAAADIDELLSRVADPERRADLLLQKAQAVVDAGRPEEGAELAQRALADDASVRIRVMARLVMANAERDRANEHVLLAYREAEAASEFNLVATVGRTAELLGVSLPAQRGPLMPTTRPRGQE